MHTSFYPVLKTFEKVSFLITTLLQKQFFDNQLSKESFVSSMLEFSTIVVKIMSLKQSHTILLSSNEFETLKLFFNLLIDHGKTELKTASHEIDHLYNEISEFTQAFEVLKAHICISDIKISA